MFLTQLASAVLASLLVSGEHPWVSSSLWIPPQGGWLPGKAEGQDLFLRSLPASLPLAFLCPPIPALGGGSPIMPLAAGSHLGPSPEIALPWAQHVITSWPCRGYTRHPNSPQQSHWDQSRGGFWWEWGSERRGKHCLKWSPDGVHRLGRVLPLSPLSGNTSIYRLSITHRRSLMRQ